DDMRYVEAFGRRECDVRVDIVGSRIDDSALAQGPAAKDIRCATEVEIVVGAKDHRCLAFTGRPSREPARVSRRSLAVRLRAEPKPLRGVRPRPAGRPGGPPPPSRQLAPARYPQPSIRPR